MATLLVAKQRQKYQFSCSHLLVCMWRVSVLWNYGFGIRARPSRFQCEFQECQTHNRDRNSTTDAM